MEMVYAFDIFNEFSISAARGPDGLLYPWGNTFVNRSVVYLDNSGGETANVGSRPEGASWVGALDMSGNLWEWVSSLDTAYPYDASHESDADTNQSRILRGGSFADPPRDLLRAGYRYRGPVDTSSYYIGIRCARSVE